jgi:hypothetical protein
LISTHEAPETILELFSPVDGQRVGLRD